MMEKKVTTACVVGTTPLRRCAEGKVDAVRTHKQLLVKNLYWSIQHYYIYNMCVLLIRDGVSPVSIRPLQEGNIF